MATDLKELIKRRYLLCLNTALTPRKIEISKDKFIIGSKEGSDLTLLNKGVEQNHAVIRISGNYCYLKIINPDGSTYVNKDRLINDERRALRSQDTISFGNVRYRYIEGLDTSHIV